MKKALVVLLAVMVAAPFVFSEIKIGVINPTKVINESMRGKGVKEKLTKLAEEKEKEVEEKSSQLQDKKEELRKFLEEAKEYFQEQYEKEMQALQEEIMPLIDEIGSEMGFTIIFDLNNAGVSYFDKAIDISDQVIKAYDARHASK